MDSHVQLFQHSDHISGLFKIENKEFRLDALEKKDGFNRHMVFYNPLDMPVVPHVCTSGLHHRPSQNINLKRIYKRQKNTTIKSCRMGLLADSSFQKQYGKDAQSKMVEAIELASQIYQQTFKVKLEVANIQFLTDTSLDINQATTINGALEALATDAGKAKSQNYCLNHLFTSKNFGTTVGLSYRPQSAYQVKGGICTGEASDSLNFGVSTSVNYNGMLNQFAWHATVVHEISHGFSAMHDEDTVKCANIKGKFMNAAVGDTTTAITGFSACSLSDISSNFDSCMPYYTFNCVSRAINANFRELKQKIFRWRKI